jgi:hypothetical protein
MGAHDATTADEASAASGSSDGLTPESSRHAFITWNRTTTTDAEWETALEVVESIEAVPFEVEGIRFSFTVPAGWDTGQPPTRRRSSRRRRRVGCVTMWP